MKSSVPAQPWRPRGARARSARKAVFISYAHEDVGWKDRMRQQLVPLSNQGVTVWDDGELAPNDAWREEIDAKLDQTRTALLIVSQHFQDSRYIRDHELPRLLEARRAREVDLVWLPVSRCDYRGGEFAEYRRRFADYVAMTDPDRPLDLMSSKDANRVLHRTAKLVAESVRGSRVLIAGSLPEDDQGFDEFREDCRSLGRALAERGYTLVIGSHRSHTADRNVMDGADGAATERRTAVLRVGTATGFAEEAREERHAEWPGLAETDLFLKDDWRHSRPEQAGNADVVVALGGGLGTSDLLYEAAWQRKLVIPVGRHGGTTKAWFHALKRRLLRAEPAAAGEKEIGRLEHEFDLELIVELLHEFTADPRGSRY